MAVLYTENVIIPLATYSADQRVRIKAPPHARALWVDIGCTSIFAGSPSVVPKIEIPDNSGGWYTILAGAAITSVSAVILKVGLEYTASANLIAQEMITEQMAIFMDHADTDDIAYKVAINWGQ